MEKDPNLCLVEDVSIEYLYRYVQSRFELKNLGLTLNGDDSVIYYKLRHNCFKTTFLSLLGIANLEEKKFCDHFEFVDSKRTPDTVLVKGQIVYIIEFTVVNDQATAIVTKKSKNKYAYEVSILQSKGYIVESYYPTLTLRGGFSQVINDLNSLSLKLNVEFLTDESSVISNLHENICQLHWDISEFLNELLSNEVQNPKVKFTNPKFMQGVDDFFPEIIRQVSVKRKRSQNIFNRLKKCVRQLEREVKYKPKKGIYLIHLNAKTGVMYIDYDDDGVTKDKILSSLNSLSLSILDLVKVVGEFSASDNPFSKFGEEPLVGDYHRDNFSETVFDTEHYERYYFSKFSRTINEKSYPKNLLANCSLDDDVPLVKDKYLDLLSGLRENKNNLVVAEKNAFIFPISSRLTYGNFTPFGFKTGSFITDIIISSIKSVQKSEMVIDKEVDYDKLNELHKEIYNSFLKLSELTNPNLARSLKKTRKLQVQQDILRDKGVTITDELLKELKTYNTQRSSFFSSVYEPTRKHYQNRVSISKSMYNAHWNNEMDHFNQEKGKIKVHPISDYKFLQSRFKGLLDYLWTGGQTMTPDAIYSETVPLGVELKKTCEQFRQFVDEDVQILMRTNLMHNLLMISRVAYSLLYHSNIKLNKEDFCYDNLGYSNVLLIVKGGKKIIANKKTRLFKLIFEIDDNVSWLYSSKFTKKITHAGKTYCVLPWQTWFFEMAKKATELYYSFSNFYISSKSESDLSTENFQNFCSVKVLNMFSQRRKLEVWFGSFRYLYLNGLSTHTSVLELIESMADYDYDPWMYTIQRCFANNYWKLCEYAKVFKIYDVFTESTIDNFDLCAEKFDECFFMTMAPFDRRNEHLKNLRSVLDTHDYFISKYQTVDPISLLKKSSVSVYDEDYVDQLFSDDFKFDPRLCFCIGVFASSYLSRVVGKETLTSKFRSILNESYTEISTSKGMRSNEGPFWGQKGHDVIFGDHSTRKKVMAFMRQLPNDNREFQKRLDSEQVSFKDKIEKMMDIVLEFDMKDKSQWKGSREIYVMSEMTKTLQQPIEKFFKELCSWTPNELIHKKSHVRPKFIHSQVFEYESGLSEKTYCTLDCKKWAARSNIWKYYYMVLGMKGILPADFYDYFMVVWSFMFEKKIRVQASYRDILYGNEKTKKIAGYLMKRADGDYEFTLPYSFIMGIFNYLSSFLHAFSQLYFNEKLSEKHNVSFNLVAHSDDSGGVIMSTSYEKNVKLFAGYEIFQKGCNHMMSRKKSSLSKNFFEIISNMYAKKRFIPMTHKFLANMSFEPKGNGWLDDISSVVSKVVEVFSNGGSMLQCYLVMLSMSEMIRKFYHLPRLPTLSMIPLAFGGVFNMHPIHLILIGADSQEVMLDLLENESERSLRIAAFLNVGNEYVPGKGGQVSYLLPYYKRHDSYLDMEDELKRKIKIVSMCSGKTTLGGMLSHYASMFDQGYTYSLTGVDMCQIFCSTLFNNTTVLSVTKKKNMFLKDFAKHYIALKSIDDGTTERRKQPLSNFHNYMKASESIFIDFSKITQKNMKTCKPIIYDTFQSLGIGLKFETLNEVIAFNSDLDLKFCVNDEIRAKALTDWLSKIVPGDTLENKLSTISKLSRKDFEKTRSSYCFLPSNVSVDTIERFWTYINFYCSRRYYISTEKPQYFTLDNFKLWGLEYDYLKHYYLLVKAIFLTSNFDSTFKGRVLENCKCKKCNMPEQMTNAMNEFFNLRNMEDFESIQTSLPFATYEVTQYRSANVWYGSSEFTIHTLFGSAQMYSVDGERYVRIMVDSEEILDQVWHLFNIFCYTRGILFETPTYGINDTAESKIAFNDLNVPIIAPPGYKGVMIHKSNIIQTTSMARTIEKRDSKFYYLDNPVDFEIYQNYDINEGFYNEHNLHRIQDVIFENELLLEKDYLLSNALSSKTFQILSLDESHLSDRTFEEKYKHEGLLGSQGSLTRAFALADQVGLTNYRSSVNPNKINRPLLETQSYKDIPVLDLMFKCSFARVTSRERNSLWKIALEEEMTKEDEFNLDALTNKLGLTSTAGAINLVKTVFRDLSYEDVVNVPKPEVLTFLVDMLKSALTAVRDNPFSKNKSQIRDTKSLIVKRLSLLIKYADHENLAEYLARLFLRAQLDNSGSFWVNRRENIYCALYRPEEKSLTGQSLFLKACLYRVLRESAQKLLEIRQITIGKRSLGQLNDVVDEYKDECLSEMSCDYITGRLDHKEFELMNYYLDEDMEDSLDAISGSEDPEEFNLREWDGPSEVHYLLSKPMRNKVFEYTLKKDFSNIRLKSVYGYFQYKWLGYGNFFEEYDEETDFTWFVSEFPGTSSPPIPLESYPFSKPKITQLKDISKGIAEEKVEEKLTNKRSIQGLLNDSMTDDEIFDYQIQVLKNNGIVNPEFYSKFFFKRGDVSSADHFWNNLLRKFDFSLFEKKAKYTSLRSERTSALPGFSGVLNDPAASCELKTLFGEHGEQILMGNHSIGAMSYKHTLRTIKKLFYKVDDNGKALLTLILATMKDAIITDNADSWYLEGIMGILDPLEERLDDLGDARNFLPPKPINANLRYETTNIYERRKNELKKRS